MTENGLLVIIDSNNKIDKDENTEEMKLLCQSARVNILDVVVFKRNYVDSNFFIGKGQAHCLSELLLEYNTDVIIFSENLSPNQLRNLEEITNIKVIDRTQLILDIFSQRAKSNEGKIEVELAQLKYLLPRLTGKGISMSRIGSGSGVATRGPGETKLETDKRKIKDRISKLNKELEIIVKNRKISNKKRYMSPTPSVSLVGYTSAGKSTLLSKLTGENFYSDKMLFTTLDSVVRKVNTINHCIYLSDTVGFLRNLPHNIINAFKSTLEDIKLADILIHVVDSTKDNIEDYINVVDNVLKEINQSEVPVILVFNKTDLTTRDKLQNLYYSYPNSVFISAKTGNGLNALFSKIDDIIESNFVKISIIIPYNNNNMNYIYEYGNINKIEYLDSGIYLECIVPKELYYYFQDFII